MESCPQCSRPYGKRRRCYYCQPGRSKTSTVVHCVSCGVEIVVQPNQLRRGEGKYCSLECKGQFLQGKPKVVGTRYVTTNGYVSVKTGIRQRDLEHRLVAAEMIGRRLLPGEQVHHINGDKLDNRPENLQVLTNAEHQKLHNHPQTRSRRLTLTCEACGATYERPLHRASESRFCSNACRIASMRSGYRKQP